MTRPAKAPKLRWRVGRKLGRTLYCDEKLVGMVDTTVMALAIVDAMNRHSYDVSLTRRCPRCRVGLVFEDSIGDFCSRRYAKRSPCDWQGEPIPPSTPRESPPLPTARVRARKPGRNARSKAS